MVRVRFKHWCLGVRGVSLQCVLSAEPRPRVRKKGPTASPVPQDGKNTPPLPQAPTVVPRCVRQPYPRSGFKATTQRTVTSSQRRVYCSRHPDTIPPGPALPPPGAIPPSSALRGGAGRAAAAAARPRGPLRAPSSGRGRAGTPQSRHRCPHCALQHL